MYPNTEAKSRLAVATYEKQEELVMQTDEKAKYVPAAKGLEILHEAGIPISINPYYAGLKSGEIPSIRVGHRIYVREDIVSLMEKSKTQAASSE